MYCSMSILFWKLFEKLLFSLLSCGVSFETMASISYVLQYVNRYFEKSLKKWKAYFLPYIEGFVLGMCGKSAEKYWFCGIFRRFWRVFVSVSVCGCIADCKNWKEKVFVLREYICIYMFRLCSGKFGTAAIEKNCILFELYQNSRTKTGSRKTE